MKVVNRRRVVPILAAAVLGCFAAPTANADQYGFKLGPTDDHWTTSGNWVHGAGPTSNVPGAGDDALIGTTQFGADAFASVSLNSGNVINVQSLSLGNDVGTSGTLVLNAGSSLASQQLSLGLNGGTGAVTRNGGTLSLQNLAVGSGSSLALVHDDSITGNGSFVINGTLNYASASAGGPGFTNVNDGGTLHLLGETLTSNGGLNLNPGGTLSFDGGNLSVPNGAFTVSGTASVTRSAGHFNVGVLEVNGGASMALEADDVVSGTAVVRDVGSTLDLHAANSVSQVQVYNGGTLNLNGHALSTFAITLGSADAGTLNRGGAGGTLSLSSVDLHAGSVLDILSTDTVNAGGGGSFSVEGSGSKLTYNNSSADGPFTTTVTNGGTLSLAGGTLHTSFQLGVTNGGTLRFDGGNLAVPNSFLVDGAATTVVRNGGTFDVGSLSVVNSAQLAIESGDAVSGSFTVRDAGSTVDFHAGLAGTVDNVSVNDGATLNLNGHPLSTRQLTLGGNSAGTLTRGNSAATLDLASVSLSASSTLAILPTDTFNALGTFSVNGSGSKLTYDNDSPNGPFQTNISNGGTLSLTGHTFRGLFQVSVSSGGTLGFDGGNLAVANVLSVDGPTTTVARNGGTFDVGSLDVSNGASLAVEGGDNFGSLTVRDTGSTVDLHASPASTVDNVSVYDGGTLNLNGHPLSTNGLQLGSTGAGTLTRGGAGATLNLTSVSLSAGSTLSILPTDTVNPNGTFSVDGATSQLTYDNDSPSGPFSTTVTNGGTLSLTGHTFRGAFQFAVSSGGTLSFDGGNLAVANVLSVDGPTTTVARNGGNFAVGSLDVHNGARLSVESGDSVTGSITVRDLGSSIDSHGPLTVGDASNFGVVAVYDGATLNLNGNALSAGQLQLGSTLSGTLSRGGSGATLTLTSAYVQAGSTLAILPTDTVNPNGTFSVDGATSQLTYDNDSPSGPFSTTVTNGGTLSLTGHTFRGAFQFAVSSGGTLSFDGGNLAVANVLSVDGPTTTVARNGGNFAVGSLDVHNGARLSVESGDSVTGSITVRDTGSAVDLHTPLTVGDASNIGVVTVYDGATLNLNGHPLSTGQLQLGSTTAGTLIRGGVGGTITTQVVNVQAGSFLRLSDADTIVPSGSFTVSGAGSKLQYDNTGGSGPTSTVVSSGGTLGGNGSLHGSVQIAAGNAGPGSGGILAPGASVGALSVDSLSLNRASTYTVEMASVNGTPGMGYDTVHILNDGDNFTIDTGGDPITVQLVQVGAADSAGITHYQTYQWAIVTGTNLDITQDEINHLILDTSAFTDALGTGGQFSFSADPGGLYVNYTAAPEPRSAFLFGIAAGSLGLTRWRRPRTRGLLGRLVGLPL